MRLTAKMPILFRGRPSRARKVRAIFCWAEATAEVAETTLSEMPVVFRAHAAKESGERYGRAALELRKHDGRFYRKIASSLAHAERRRLFDHPFDELCDRDWEAVRGRPFSHRGAAISPDWPEMEGNPLVRALFDEFDWHALRGDDARNGSKSAWPEIGSARQERGWHDHRNDADLMSILEDAADVRQHDIAAAREMHAVQLGKLLIADGELWMRCRPPCLSVQYRPGIMTGPENFANPPYPDATSITVTTAPEAMVTDLHCWHFPLSAADEAEDFAERMHRPRRKPRFGIGKEMTDYRGAYEWEDVREFDFDHRAEEIDRVGYILAATCAAARKRHEPFYERRLDQTTKADLDAVREFASRSNHVLGDTPNMTPYLDLLTENWMALGHRMYLTDWPMHKRLADLYVQTARDYALTRPISLELDHAFDGAPAPGR